MVLALILLLLLLESYLNVLVEGGRINWLIRARGSDALIIDLCLDLCQLRGLLVKIGSHTCSLQQLH